MLTWLRCTILSVKGGVRSTASRWTVVVMRKMRTLQTSVSVKPTMSTSRMEKYNDHLSHMRSADSALVCNSSTCKMHCGMIHSKSKYIDNWPYVLCRVEYSVCLHTFINLFHIEEGSFSGPFPIVTFSTIVTSGVLYRVHYPLLDIHGFTTYRISH